MKLEAGTATVTGDLTIRGISRSVTAHGTYQLPTEDPLPSGGDALGWDVEITAHLELIKTT